VAPGVTSQRVYVTNLYNTTLPLIRYEVTDEVTLLGPCPCGSPFQRIADPQGRLDDLFAYAGGVVIHPHVFRSVLGRSTEVVEYQVRQTGTGADVRAVMRSGATVSDFGRTLEEALTALGLSDPAVSVTVVDGLDRLATGKLRRFVPLAPTDCGGRPPIGR
jgi:phenylacetate-coenzyme A ligase PaaK-like adenylate-forming protein